MATRKIPFLSPELPDLDLLRADFETIHRSGVFSNGGPFETKLEDRICGLLDAPYCLAVSNATTGLMIAIRDATRHSRGRRVLLPSFTFAASALAVRWAGMEPVFCDIDPQGWQPTATAEQLRELGEDLGLILLCNTFGAPSDVARWSELARNAGVPIIVDSAAGMAGCYADGRKFGSAGLVEVFSMHATKAFAVGEGGIVACPDEETFTRLRGMRNFGFDENGACTAFGLNGKLTELHAAIACRVLEGFDAVMERRRDIMGRYHARLALRKFRFQLHAEQAVYQALPVRVPEGIDRAELRRHLTADGIETRQYFSNPLHTTPEFRECRTIGPLAETERASHDALSLPMGNRLSDDDVDYICASIEAFVS